MHSLAAFLIRLGAFGLLILGVLDSSFLFMPLGNDLLMVALSARKPAYVPLFAVMASAGSVLGVLLVDVIFRRGGEQALERHVAPKRLQYVKRKVSAHAAWALGLACLMPPPFPFTPFVMVSAALQYPRKKLLTVVGVFRFVRFGAAGALAAHFGPRILKIADHPAVQYSVIAIIFIAFGGSAWSVYRWISRSRRKPERARK